jgi:hypothetical protein
MQKHGSILFDRFPFPEICGKNDSRPNKKCYIYFSYFFGPMYKFFFLFSLLMLNQAYSSGQSDSVRNKLKADFNVSLNSNGIASIPAFSLGAPAIIASAGLAKGRFSYDPVLAYGVDMKPWYIDSWLHYKIIDRTSFKFRTGINFSNFFTEVNLSDEVIMKSERYWALELAGMYYFDEKTSLTLMYWRDKGKDPGTISGHFITLIGDKSGMPLGRYLVWGANIQLFYIDYTGNNDGLFVTPKLSVSALAVPITLFLQATQAIVSNVEPFPGFEWNIGVAYTF